MKSLARIGLIFESLGAQKAQFPLGVLIFSSGDSPSDDDVRFNFFSRLGEGSLIDHASSVRDQMLAHIGTVGSSEYGFTPTELVDGCTNVHSVFERTVEILDR